MNVHLPPGVAGPEALDFDVRSFLVAHVDGIVLIDAGTAGSHDAINHGLARVGATWADITDVVLTHAHADHVGGLEDVMANASRASVWAGVDDQPAIGFSGELQDLVEGGTVRNLRVLQTPGHTAGHCSLVRDDSILFAGDIAGSTAGSISRGPAPFTADAAEAERSLQRVADLEFDRVLFSHGEEVADPIEALRRLAGDRG